MKNSVSRCLFFVFLLLFSAAMVRADYLTIPAAAFHGWYTDSSSVYFVGTACNNRYIYTLVQPGDAGFCYAPVSLPNGATINGIMLFYWDNDINGDIEVLLQSNAPTTDAYHTLFSTKTSGAYAGIQYKGDWSLDGGSRIVNSNFQYTLRLQFGVASTELKCYGVRIIYH
jgi:hypothetical protein